MVAIAQRDSASIQTVFYNYLMNYGWQNAKQKLIQTVGAENLK
jgi:hypothetical protein